MHIIRNYKPDVIYIFLTKEMDYLDEKLNLYELAARKVVPGSEIIKLRHPEFDKPHDFQLSHEIVSRDLNEVLSRHKDDEVIVNVTSATTQIQNCIYLNAAVTKKPYKLIQVLTPKNASNDSARVDINFNLENEWANNLDNLTNDPEIKSRCIEITPGSARKIMAAENILSHIRAYDYKAAYQVAMENRPIINDNICTLLNAAALRLSLFFEQADEMASKTGYRFVTVRSGDAMKIFEYLIYVKIRMEQREVCEFARAVTPLFLELGKAYLDKVCNIRLLQYCERRNGIYWLCRSKLQINGDLIQVYDQAFPPLFRDSELAFSNILPAIEFYCARNNRFKDLENVKKLRDFEKKVRNVAAHQIEGLTPEMLRKKYGFDMEQIFDCIKSFFSVTFSSYVKNNPEIWDTYLLLNAKISDLLTDTAAEE